MEARGVSDDDMATIGGVSRKLSDLLTEVAEGRSEMIYMG